MNKYALNSEEKIENAPDNWLMQWVEERASDFENVELDDFILID
jgi:hypothetical protein